MFEEIDMRSVFIGIALLSSTAVHAQNIAAGERIFRRCASCHDVGPTARIKIGPPLNGIFGRKAATVGGYNYSAAMKSSNIVWDDASFIGYMTNPRSFVPGTSQGFGGIDDATDIQNLAAYLKQFDSGGKVISATTESAPAAGTPAVANADPAAQKCIENFGHAESAAACRAAGGEVLQAVGVIVAARAGEAYGFYDGSVLIGRGEVNGQSYVRRLRPSASDPCEADEIVLAQGAGLAAPEVLETNYDFKAIGDQHYMINGGNIVEGSEEKLNDPTVTGILFDGRNLLCRELIGIDAKSRVKRECLGGMLVRVEGAERKALVAKALGVIRRACKR